MVTCTLLDDKASGRFGNKLFVIAALIGCSEPNSDKPILPEWEYSDIFKHKITTYPLKDMKVMTSRLYREPSFSYKKIPYEGGLDIIGYFQSEKYFEDCELSIRKYFALRDDLQKIVDEKYEKYEDCRTASIHVRRGDYLNYPDTHPLCNGKYYNDAIKMFRTVDKFLVFSDDPDWCRQNFNLGICDIIEGNPDYIDMALMAKCDNNIIANSSFSWWGAWLNPNPNKVVIAPKDWFGKNGPKDTQDLIPDGWVVL